MGDEMKTPGEIVGIDGRGDAVTDIPVEGTPGQIAERAYRKFWGDKSLWDDTSVNIRAGWEATAIAVLESCVIRPDDVIVIRLPAGATADMAMDAADHAAAVLPGKRIVVTASDVEIRRGPDK